MQIKFKKKKKAIVVICYMFCITFILNSCIGIANNLGSSSNMKNSNSLNTNIKGINFFYNLKNQINKNKAVSIAVDQIGYTPQDNAKLAIVNGGASGEFRLINAINRRCEFSGKLCSVGKDMQEYNVADFSQFSSPGKYYIEVDNIKSVQFKINDNIYESVTYSAMRYFTLQRRGNTYLNYERRPTFLDDGIRSDNKKRIDVVGGWNDACDYRGWSYCLGFGLNFLPFANKVGNYKIDAMGANSEIPNGISDYLDEAIWGAEYFLKLQDPLSGMIYPYCGADDTNYMTDNIIGSNDDRIVDVVRDNKKNVHKALFVQYEVASGLALLSNELYDINPAYSKKLKTAAQKACNYAISKEAEEPIYAASELSFKAICGVNMYELAIKYNEKETADKYKSSAIDAAQNILSCQQNVAYGVGGWFWPIQNYNLTNPSVESYSGGMPLIAISEVYRAFKDSIENVQEFKFKGTLYIEGFVKSFAGYNPFGILPVDIRGDNSTGAVRQISNSSYKYNYFAIVPKDYTNWGVGNNGMQVGNAAALLSAIDSGLVDNDELKEFAIFNGRRIAHYIHGANPQNISFIRGYGIQGSYFNYFRGKLEITGALIAGSLGAAKTDNPVLLENSYNCSEYWTPYNSLYITLMAYLSRIDNNKTVETPIINAVYPNGNGALVDFERVNTASNYKIVFTDIKSGIETKTSAYNSPAKVDGLNINKTYTVSLYAENKNAISKKSNELTFSPNNDYTFADDFKTLEKVYSSSEITDTPNGEIIGGDESYIVYSSLSDIKKISIKIKKSNKGEITLYASSDVNGTFTKIKSLSCKDEILIFNYIPLSTKYIKIQFKNLKAKQLDKAYIESANQFPNNWWVKQNIAPNATITETSGNNDALNSIIDGIAIQDKGAPYVTLVGGTAINLIFKEPVEVSTCEIFMVVNMVLMDYKLQYKSGNEWLNVTMPVIGNVSPYRLHNFSLIKANEFRIVLDKNSNQGGYLTIAEIFLR